MRKAPLIIAAIAVVAPLSAQGVFNMGMLTNTVSQGANVQSEQARAARRSFPTLIRPQPRAVRINPAIALYRPNMAVRQRNMRQFIARTKQVDPAAGAELERVFAKADVIGQFSTIMRRDLKLNPNNVADAMAVYLVTAWYGVRGSDASKPADLPPVVRQLTRGIATTPDFARASDATKQEIAESMMLQAMLTDQNFQIIRKTNPSMMPQFRQAVATGARRSFGMDLTRLRLGPNGLQ